MPRRRARHARSRALSEELDAHLDELTTRVIREAIDDDVSEPTENAPKAVLPAPDDG